MTIEYLIKTGDINYRFKIFNSNYLFDEYSRKAIDFGKRITDLFNSLIRSEFISFRLLNSEN